MKKKLQHNSYTRISQKYSDRTIRTEKDVEIFYSTLNKKYPESRINEIMMELTDEIYNHSELDVINKDCYPKITEYRQVNSQ